MHTQFGLPYATLYRSIGDTCCVCYLTLFHPHSMCVVHERQTLIGHAQRPLANVEQARHRNNLFRAICVRHIHHPQHYVPRDCEWLIALPHCAVDLGGALLVVLHCCWDTQVVLGRQLFQSHQTGGCARGGLCTYLTRLTAPSVSTRIC